ncbi:MAG TPA: response regulator [bacterium]|nr:response regulator [bacterium]
MEKRTVLLVDDNELNRKVIAKIVESLGYETISASSGVEALQIFNHDKPDMILMDCRMPDMDGFDTTKIIRQIEKVNDIKPVPVIAVTADDKSEEWEKCQNAGMNDFISKPVDVAKLAEVMKKYSFKSGDAANIDLNALMISADSDPVWAKELLVMFMADTVERIEQIEKMIAEKKFNKDDATRHFHTIKSSAASIGAMELSNLAKKMENFVKNGELTNITDNFQHMKDELKRSSTVLENGIDRKINEKS